MKADVNSKIDMLNAKLNTLTISLNVMLFDKETNDIQELGRAICAHQVHKLENGGMWLWEYNTDKVFYSDGFSDALEFEHGELGDGFGGFDQGNKEDMLRGLKMIQELIYKKSIDPFINPITYRTKSNKLIPIECIGSVFYKGGEPYIVLGTHKILNK